MSQVYLFPGQGAQFRGMGKDLFARFPDLVSQADELLGYSIRELCLKDPDGLLNQTQYTQPALFVVNALYYYSRQKAISTQPAYVAGHSLGEFNALLAASAFDFATGLEIVAKRGEIMSKSKNGKMAAVLSLVFDEVKQVLADHNLDDIDLANINSEMQVIISGPSNDIDKAKQIFEKMSEQSSVRIIELPVSAAFHSRLMKESQIEFETFLNGISFNPLDIPVVSNWTGQLYPKTDYANHIAMQLSNPVLWYQSISRLLLVGESEFIELGPSDVLTKLYKQIRSKPADVLKFESDQVKPSKKNIFMYSGQGSQHRQMGKELYDRNKVFRQSLDSCSAIVEKITGRSLVNDLYKGEEHGQEFSDIRITHPAIFSFGYSLTQALIDTGLKVDAVLGYSLGEYVAATIAHSLSLDEALGLVVNQAEELSRLTKNGGMLTVIAPISHYYKNPDIYQNVELAGINYEENYVLSGSKVDLEEVQKALDSHSIPTMFLPVEYAFHSSKMLVIETEFKSLIEGVLLRSPQIPIFSSTSASELKVYREDHFWNVTREGIRFADLVNSFNNTDLYRFIDCSPTGVLDNFIKYSSTGLEHYAAVKPFGRNKQTINQLVNELSE